MKPGFVKFPDGLGENKRGECLPIEPLVRSISNRFDEENILWAVMRNAEDLPEFTRNDIDFLISHTDLGKVTDIIKQCAQQTGWRIVSRIVKSRYVCLMLMRTDESGGCTYLPLDLCMAIEYRGVSYLSTEDILARRIQTPNKIWTLPAGFDAAITVLKEWLPHGDLSERKRESVRVLSKQDSEGFMSAMTAAVGADWAERVLSERWSLNSGDHLVLRRALGGNILARSIGWVRAARDATLQMFRPSLGMVICLAGADGSGKTTFSKGLAEKTFKKPFKGCRYIHGNVGVLPRFRDMRCSVVRKGVESKHEDPTETLQGMMEPVPAWKSVLLASYYAVDFFLAGFLIRRWRSQWLLTVMDRSFYDYYYQLGHRNCPHWVLNCLLLIVPKPDLFLCVEGDAEAMHERKPELTVEEIRIEQNILRGLCERFSFAHIIDAHGKVEETLRNGLREVTQYMTPLRLLKMKYLFQSGKPIAAVPAGTDWALFPALSLKREFVKKALCVLSALKLDGMFLRSNNVSNNLLNQDEIETLLVRLRSECPGESLKWMMCWPAQLDRQRQYLIFKSSLGSLSGVVKIGRGEFNQNQFSNEASSLTQLGSLDLPFSIPSVLFQIKMDECRDVLALVGFPTIAKRLNSEDAKAASEEVIASLGVWVHGDLGVANIQRQTDGRLFVYDWENASKNAPRFLDDIGLWLSSRQREVLHDSKRVRSLLYREFSLDPTLITEALEYLSQHDNLGAKLLLEVPEC